MPVLPRHPATRAGSGVACCLDAAHARAAAAASGAPLARRPGRARRAVRARARPTLNLFACAGAHQLPQQPQAAGPRQGLRPPLQHGAGEREGDVDRGARGPETRRAAARRGARADALTCAAAGSAHGQGAEEGQAGAQGPLHHEDVPAGRQRDSGASQPEVRLAHSRRLAAGRGNGEGHARGKRAGWRGAARAEHTHARRSAHSRARKAWSCGHLEWLARRHRFV